MTKCSSCGDIADRLLGKGVPLCVDCFNELAHGVVRNQNVCFFPPGPILQVEEPCPCQENAIRILEDMQT